MIIDDNKKKILLHKENGKIESFNSVRILHLENDFKMEHSGFSKSIVSDASGTELSVVRATLKILVLWTRN